MPNYDYDKDIEIARQTEIEVSKLLIDKYRATIMNFEHTNKYDILTVVNGKTFKFEVKEDFTCKRTGNVGMEIKCRGKPSGIMISEADFYIYKIHTVDGIKFFIFKTSALKKMIDNREFFTAVNGGDKDSGSINYLFRYATFIRRGKLIHG
jgi:penicillin-binding protein-related factor A (putative recombinase)